jgi:HlyD family secretion protein
MRGTWLRILGILIFVGGLSLLGVWWLVRGQSGETPREAPAPVETAPVPEAPPPAMPANNNLVLSGVIEPYETVPVSSKFTANLARLLVRQGETVRKGQLLCILDDTEIVQQIDQARLALLQATETLRAAREKRTDDTERKQLALSDAQQDLTSCRAESDLQLQKADAAVKQAEREVSDAEALYKAKAVSAEEVRKKQEVLEDAQRSQALTKTSIDTNLFSRQAAVKRAQLDANSEPVTEQDLQAYELAAANAENELATRQSRLADTRITAPVGGTVNIIPRTQTTSSLTGQSAEVLGQGVRIYEGDPFLEIATSEQACLRLEVDETDITRLQVGLPAKITGDAFAGRELQGRLATIGTSGRKAGEGVSLFPVTILVTSPLEGVRMGMTADVNLELPEAKKSEDKP